MWNDNEFNSTFSSPNANAGKEIKKTLIKYVVPVTAQTISLCNQVEGETSVFEYNQLRFHQIYFIGIIRSVVKRANDITYLVDDMTSTCINVKLQSDDSDEMETEEDKTHSQFIENQYVKVFGIIKSLQGQKNVQAFRILPIKELNELTYHMLECMNATIYFSNKSAGNDGMDIGMGNPLKNANFGGNNYESHGSSSSGGLTGIHLQISSMVKQNKSSEGVNVKDVCAYFKNIPENKIREAMEFLSTEGHIYSTIDDEHFKTTDGYD